MNYKKIYDELINTRKILNRKKNNGIYYEKHHIIPKSCGGSNDPDNLILLTFKEHFFAHRLLVEIYNGELKRKMNYALWRMSSSNKNHKRIINSSQYSICRQAQLNAKTNHSRSEITKKKISDGHKGKKLSQETKEKLRKINLGKRRVISEETKKKIGESNKGKKRTNEVNEKNRLRNIGKKQSIETIDKRRKKLLGKPRPTEVIDRIKKNNTQKKKVMCSNGIIYESINDAAKKLNLCQSNISSVCRGKRKKTGNLFFKFI